MLMRRPMSIAVRERTKREASPPLSPWILRLLVRGGVVRGLAPVAKERMGRALLLQVGDEVPEGSCLVVVSYGGHGYVVTVGL